MTITVKLAGIPIGIGVENDYTKKLCRDFLTDEKPLFSVGTSKEKILSEMRRAYSDGVSEPYAESLCIYREIAERLPSYNRVVFHGAAIKYKDSAYIFTGPSGIGKTTHISLWKKYLGDDVSVINGDKPILFFDGDGVTVFSTPYAGKEDLYENVSAKLAKIVIVKQAKENSVLPLDSREAYMSLLKQTYIPHEKEAARKTIGLVNSLCRIPCFLLSCDISEKAFTTSFEAMVNTATEVK